MLHCAEFCALMIHFSTITQLDLPMKKLVKSFATFFKDNS